MLLRAVILLSLLALLLPGSAAAAVRMVVRDEPVAPAGRELAGLTRLLPASQAPQRFNLVGLHWSGSGGVWFRTREDSARWSPWNEAMPEAEDQPDAGTQEGHARAGWRLGNPWWTGSARWIQYRLEGDVHALRAYFLWSPRQPERVASTASAPAVIPRSAWGADESIVREKPLIAPELRLAIVHHTAGANAYSAADSAAIVRGIEVYHVKANGWNDIGYNFLVDKYGQLFEGRAGGITRNVVGAHAQGFNTGSVGVAVLGSYGAESISPAAENALVQLLAWRLDVAHVDPAATLTVASGGNERFGVGDEVTLRAISGHRDTGSTACPGNALYGQLDQIAAEVAATGLPKLFEPIAAPTPLQAGPDGSIVPVALSARLSKALQWTIAVTDDRSGEIVASASGNGSAVAWTWDGRGPGGETVDLAGSFTATISAPGVTPASIELSAGAPPAPGSSGDTASVSGVTVEPSVITPNADGKADSALVSFTLSAPAAVSVQLEDESGAVVATMTDSQLPAGKSELRWSGLDTAGAPVLDGRYEVVVTAGPPAQATTRSAPITVDRTIGSLAVTPPRLSPNGDGRNDTLSIDFLLSRSADVTVTILRGATPVAALANETLSAGPQRVSWDGLSAGGLSADGPYTVRVEATTILGTRRLASKLVIDRSPPQLRVLSAVTRRSITTLRLRLSEAVHLQVRGAGGTRTFDRAAGTRKIAVPASPRRLQLKAWDTAGNAAAPVMVSPRG